MVLWYGAQMQLLERWDGWSLPCDVLWDIYDARELAYILVYIVIANSLTKFYAIFLRTLIHHYTHKKDVSSGIYVYIFKRNEHTPSNLVSAPQQLNSPAPRRRDALVHPDARVVRQFIWDLLETYTRTSTHSNMYYRSTCSLAANITGFRNTGEPCGFSYFGAAQKTVVSCCRCDRTATSFAGKQYAIGGAMAAHAMVLVSGDTQQKAGKPCRW